jgi:3-deoxy-7-phosphoheptulonate synthase
LQIGKNQQMDANRPNSSDSFKYIVGPCSIESYQQMEAIAQMATELNISYLRAAIFKPRTRPESFQGIGAVEGLKILNQLKSKYPQLKFVTEVCSIEQLLSVKDSINAIQVGARNMQNFELLKAIAKSFNPSQHEFILLKRGFANTLEEWISAADYLIFGGIAKEKIILCERGQRCSSAFKGVSIDFNTAMAAKILHGFKVMIDPSHGTKDRRFVTEMLKLINGQIFSGTIVEVHPTPALSVSDAEQAISIEDFTEYMQSVTTTSVHAFLDPTLIKLDNLYN